MDKKTPPDFALLIGKRLAKIEKGMDDMSPPEEGGEMEPDGDEAQADEMEHSAMESLIDAIHSKDAMAAKEALKDFLEICLEEHEEGGGY